MKAFRYAIVGGGWRAEFFLRAAQYIPEVFEVSAVYLRHPEKYPHLAERYQVNIVDNEADLLKSEPEFVVLCVDRKSMADLIVHFAEQNLPVLCETPPAADIQGLNDLWKRLGSKEWIVQVAEQYFLQPLYAAWLNFVRSGKLGELQNLNISAVHDYHAVSLIRLFLDEGMNNCTVEAKDYDVKTIQTDGRGGPRFDNVLQTSARRRAVLHFSDGKPAFYDFCAEQYRSYIRERHFTLQGTHGEITDLQASYLDENLHPVTLPLQRANRGEYNNREWAIHTLRLGENILYENPFFGARLNDDELAVASILKGMGEFVRGGEPIYPLREGLQDTYLCFLFEESAKNGGQSIQSEFQAWAE